MTSVNSLYTEITIPPVLNPESIGDLTRQLENVENINPRFIVLKGSDTIFCNGLDLSWVVNSKEENHRNDMRNFAAFLKKLQGGKFISVALVKGVVSGGGMGVVCACDYAIADESSTFSLPEGLLGLIPGMILPSLLNRLSPQQVKKMMFTGKKYSAATALESGLIDEINNDQQTALNNLVNSMRSCKANAVEDIKDILYFPHVSKDELAKMGMDMLSKRLKDPEIKQRLKDISDFM